MEPTSNPTVEQLRERAAEILSGRDYRLNDRRADNSWLFALILEILEWILVPFRWLFELTAGLPSFLRWMIVLGLAVLAIVLIVHIAYTLVTAIRIPKRVSDSGLDTKRRGIGPSELDRLAYEAAGRSDFITAIRFLFRASVVRLELFEKKSNRPGTTNRELLRRYQNRPELSSSLRKFVETIDRKWYGDELCSGEDFQSCERAHGDVCRAVGEPSNALCA